MGHAKSIFIGLLLVIVAVLLRLLGTEFVALAVSLVLVPLLVLSLSYECWKETRAKLRELIFFVTVSSFMGLFPIYLKSFIALLKGGEVFGVWWEIIGGLLGFGFFLFTLNDAIGHPVRRIARENLRALPSYGLLQETRALATRAGVKVRDILTLPAEMLAPKLSLATGLTTKNVYLADSLVEVLSDDEVKSAVARELWHFKYLDLWINFLVYCGWLLLLSLYRVMSWWLIFLFGGVLFSFFLPLIGRMKELAADRYGRRLVGSPGAFLGMLHKQTELAREERDRGLVAKLKGLLSTRPPLSLRIHYAWQELRGKPLPAEVVACESELRAQRKDARLFLALQGLIFTLVVVLLLLPRILAIREIITVQRMRLFYAIEAVLLYGSFVARVWWRIYQTLRAHRRRVTGGVRESRLPWWGYVLPLVLLGVAGWAAYRYPRGRQFFIAALLVALGIFCAAVLTLAIRRHAEARFLKGSGEPRDKGRSGESSG